MDQFQHCFVKWVTDLHDTLEGVVAIDGKTLRRSFDTGSDKAAIHMVSARACQQKPCRGSARLMTGPTG